MAKKPYDSLGIPPAARSEGGVELMRAAVVEQKLAMALRRGFDDPAAWGALLATAARQVAQIYATDTGVSVEAARARIREAFDADMNAADDDAGTITAVR
jgi:hypothetical protein